MAVIVAGTVRCDPTGRRHRPNLNIISQCILILFYKQQSCFLPSQLIYQVCRVQQKLFLRKAIMEPETIVFNSSLRFFSFNYGYDDPGLSVFATKIRTTQVFFALK